MYRVSLLPDYSRQAERYDETRSASPSVLRVLREALKGVPGRRLADIGGGTGNYALALRQEGWEPVVVDRSADMLAWAAAKGLETVEADAQRLPFEDETFDAATMISMLHHVEDRGAALAEARRVLRPRGRLVLKGYTGEDAASLWISTTFQAAGAGWMRLTRRGRRYCRSYPAPGSSRSNSRTWRTHRSPPFRPTLIVCWRLHSGARRATLSGCGATILTSFERGSRGYVRTSRLAQPRGAPVQPRCSVGDPRRGQGAVR